MSRDHDAGAGSLVVHVIEREVKPTPGGLRAALLAFRDAGEMPHGVSDRHAGPRSDRHAAPAG